MAQYKITRSPQLSSNLSSAPQLIHVITPAWPQFLQAWVGKIKVQLSHTQAYTVHRGKPGDGLGVKTR